MIFEVTVICDNCDEQSIWLCRDRKDRIACQGPFDCEFCHTMESVRISKIRSTKKADRGPYDVAAKDAMGWLSGPESINWWRLLQNEDPNGGMEIEAAGGGLHILRRRRRKEDYE
jgi:hypothetical protein